MRSLFVAAVVVITIGLAAPPAHATTCAAGGACAIGDTGPGGGLVIIAPSTVGNSTGQFFEAAVNTWNGTAPDGTGQWCNASTSSIAGLGNGIGSGITNTATVAAACASTGTGDAAEYISGLTIGGHTDWFLPSRDEMLALYDQRTLLIGTFATNQVNVDVARYLTSSQATNTVNAVGAYMEGSAFPGTAQDFSKQFNFSLRPMRMFSVTESSSSSSGSGSPPLESLMIRTPEGVTCINTSVGGVQGTWITLPSSDDCSASAEPKARVLGWATSPDFPVGIAQRQVDNGWGAYELFDDDGRMTAVFIPAGGATLLSGSTNLYPILSV